MSSFTETVTETFRLVSCYTCGVRFGIGSDLYRRAVTNAEGQVHCPARGKTMCWRESDSQKRIKELEQRLDRETREMARQKQARELAESSLIATKGVVTRMKRRSAAGVCPCCNRTFKQLSAHMQSKHPQFSKS